MVEGISADTKTNTEPIPYGSFVCRGGSGTHVLLGGRALLPARAAKPRITAKTDGVNPSLPGNLCEGLGEISVPILLGTLTRV